MQPASASRAKWPVTDDASASPRLCASSIRLGGTPWRRMCALMPSRTSCCRFVSSRMAWFFSWNFTFLRSAILPQRPYGRCQLVSKTFTRIPNKRWKHVTK